MPIISSLRLENYRGFQDVVVPLRAKTVLIGSNNSGKTSIIEAIDKIFGVGRRGYGFEESDLSRGSLEGDICRVTVELRPESGLEFSTKDSTLFETHIDSDNAGEVVYICVESTFDAEGVFRSQGQFLKVDGDPDGSLDPLVRRSLPFFYLPAVRDARFELDERRGLWARLVNLLDDAADPEGLAELSEKAGKDVLAAVLGENRSSEIEDAVNSFLSRVLYVEDDATSAELAASSVDHRALLRRADLLVSVPGDDRPIPIREQSTGIQTLALFGLFRAYLDTHGGRVLAVGLEEPEAHLAPHAARSLTVMATDKGQSILTTHAPIIADLTEPQDLVLARRHGSDTRVTFIPDGTFTGEQLGHLRRSIRRSSSAFLFGRLVLLVEGESEVLALPELARQLDYDFDRLGVAVVSTDGPGFGPLVTLLGQRCLDIPHMMLVDRDQTQTKLVKQLIDRGIVPTSVDPANPAPSALSAADVWRWSLGDFESMLLAGGGFNAYEAAADLLFGLGSLPKFRRDIWVKMQGNADGGKASDEAVLRAFLKKRRRKPELAYEAACALPSLGLSVPTEARELINAASAAAIRVASLEVE